MVGKIEVIFSKNVIFYLDELVYVLYKNEYFGFIETAEEYVSAIYDNVSEIILMNNHNQTPKSLQHFGKFYIFYKSNERTTWFVFFEKSNDRILVKRIINNHSEEANLI
ncbi:MAG: hypothetical protein V4548_08860 [Bacteroidota bacterium]